MKELTIRLIEGRRVRDRSKLTKEGSMTKIREIRKAFRPHGVVYIIPQTFWKAFNTIMEGYDPLLKSNKKFKVHLFYNVGRNN